MRPYTVHHHIHNNEKWKCMTTQKRLKNTFGWFFRFQSPTHLLTSKAFWEGKHAFILVCPHRSIFRAHLAVCLTASGQRDDTSFLNTTCLSWWPVPASRSSIQSTCHFCQWQDMQKWILKHGCILTVAAAIHQQGQAYLQWAASISFTWEKERQLQTEQETTCPDRSLYSVLTCSPSAGVLYWLT